MEEDPFTAPASRLDCTCGAMGAETYKFIETIISGCRSLKKDKKRLLKLVMRNMKEFQLSFRSLR